MHPPDVRKGLDGTADLPAETARLALERVLASRGFRASDTLRRLLRYIVESALENRADRLKEYSLGIDVLDRAADFDPRIDSIVRVEASRLRGRLADYYSTEGLEDPVRIEIPKGTYVPKIRPAATQMPARLPSPRRSVRKWALGLACAGVCAAAILWISTKRPPAAHPAAPSIAILPFVDLSSGPDAAYLGDGITEEITNSLARVPGLRVAARSSAFQFKGHTADVREVGGKLNVGAVLEGSVRQSGGRLRITAELVNTADGFYRWSETYDRPAGELLRVPAEVALAVVGNLGLKAAVKDTRLWKRRTESTDAYNLVLKARYLTGAGDSPEERIACYEGALAYDPSYPDAYIGLAEERIRLSVWGTVAPREAMEKAREAVNQAIQLNDDVPEAHFSSAMVKWTYEWDWPGAEREFARALELNPNFAQARIEYARYLALMGRGPDALAQLDRIRVLDSVSPELRSVEAAVFYFTRDFDRTIQHARAVIAARPDIWLLYFWLGSAYQSKGMLPEAIAVLEKWRDIPGNQKGRGFGTLASAYARAGRKADALRLLNEALAKSKNAHVSPCSLALVYIGLGDERRAMDWLEKAYAERDHSLVALKADPVYDPLRRNPRFTALLTRMKL